MFRIRVTSSSGDLDGSAVVSPCSRGTVTLLRQKIFKGEPLIPVQPTDHVLILFPVNYPSSSTGTDISKQEQNILVMIEKYVERIRIDATVELSLVTCIMDQCHGTVCLVIALALPSQLIDVLAHCDECRAIDPCNSRRAIAFPCDMRPQNDEHVDAEYFALPSCTLCLDRLERSISGLTVPVCYCEDAIKCQCIMSCTCAVCQAFVLNSAAVMDERIRCTACSARDDVWICLVCGYVGCSRYQAQHAKLHYQSSLHDFSLSTVTQQVWDYDADRYVHRLIVSINGETGKSERMHFPEREMMPFDAEQLAKGSGGEVSKMLTDAKYDAKIEQCCTEYTQLLASQLALQRDYYDRQLAETSHSLSAPPAMSSCPAAAAASSPSLLADAKSSPLDMFQSLVVEQQSVSRAVRDWVSLRRAVDTLGQELTQRQGDEHQAQILLDQLKSEYKVTVSQVDEELMQLDQQVKDLQETISETRLNIAAQKSIARSMKGETMSGSMMVLQEPPKKDRRRK